MFDKMDKVWDIVFYVYLLLLLVYIMIGKCLNLDNSIDSEDVTLLVMIIYFKLSGEIKNI